MNNTITKKDIDNILKDTLIKVEQFGPKTTVLKATLPNGFVIVESSSCIDPENFSMKIGEEICMDKLIDKIWELEGYRLQCELKEAEPVKSATDNIDIDLKVLAINKNELKKLLNILKEVKNGNN